MNGKKTTMVVFSGDLDKALAAFIIATGSAAMGNQVSMFFTFWGLNIMRKDQVVNVKKSWMDKTFGWLLPRGPEKLGLSKLHFAGLGPIMMRRVMQKKNVATLNELIQMALELDIKLIACTMSMEVLGIQKEELIDGMEFAGVATYISEANDGNINLFI
ncbi:peroxiredoxin family protein [Laceyella sediminis]|jgi:peroxiredoxin family protein|uniref:Peroxiredoxin family protein n=1 Tax=Laceyella sediminis TaxID=573074 RepID=A0ABX5EPV1_9BACL|nr:DsrE/DsrF/DrsH-like family protein [Laceyella sediminis]PRZ15310.1 peroxiredoxin family protein [Laceyella sediminis]